MFISGEARKHSPRGRKLNTRPCNHGATCTASSPPRKIKNWSRALPYSKPQYVQNYLTTFIAASYSRQGNFYKNFMSASPWKADLHAIYVERPVLTQSRQGNPGYLAAAFSAASLARRSALRNAAFSSLFYCALLF